MRLFVSIFCALAFLGSTGCSPKEGKIGFQFEGTPYQLRQVSLVRLD